MTQVGIFGDQIVHLGPPPVPESDDILELEAVEAEAADREGNPDAQVVFGQDTPVTTLGAIQDRSAEQGLEIARVDAEAEEAAEEAEETGEVEDGVSENVTEIPANEITEVEGVPREDEDPNEEAPDPSENSDPSENGVEELNPNVVAPESDEQPEEEDSEPAKAKDVVEAIEAASSIEEVDALAKDDDRATVVKAAEKRKAELSA